MKRTMLLLLFLLSINTNCYATQQDTLLIVFWNVENFFDYHSESKPQYWTSKRFYAKANDISKTLFRIATKYGRYPDIIAFAEIENRYVLSELKRKTLLKKLDYDIIHYDSYDHRGIDCALLYRSTIISLEKSYPVHITDPLSGEIFATRDILFAQFTSQLTILVNHHPSKFGSSSTDTKSERRSIAFEKMNNIVDSLGRGQNGEILCIGDFNDELWGSEEGRGTIKYNGKWEKIDGFFHYGTATVIENIFDDELLLTKDKNFGGLKPRRTFLGPRYIGGISDHLPIVIVLKF